MYIKSNNCVCKTYNVWWYNNYLDNSTIIKITHLETKV